MAEQPCRRVVEVSEADEVGGVVIVIKVDPKLEAGVLLLVYEGNSLRIA